MLEEKQCYVRCEKHSWERARSHHEYALQSYRSLYIDRLDPGEVPMTGAILTSHENGGIFVGYFTFISENVYEFEDEGGNRNHLIIEYPAKITKMNREIV
jgi:hypothetical protein